MTIVGFAYFVITSCGDPDHPSYCKNNDGKQINGVFVALDSADSTGTSGTYDPDEQHRLHNSSHTMTPPRKAAPQRDQIKRDMVLVWAAIIAVVLIILLITLVTLHPEMVDPLANAIGDN